MTTPCPHCHGTGIVIDDIGCGLANHYACEWCEAGSTEKVDMEMDREAVTPVLALRALGHEKENGNG